jgi:hypothetical protein
LQDGVFWQIEDQETEDLAARVSAQIAVASLHEPPFAVPPEPSRR